MTMRMAAALSLVAMLLAVPALAQEDSRPPMDLPVYPGGEAGLEINLTQEDLLPTLQALLPMFAGRLKLGDDLSAEELGSIFKDVTRIEVLQLDVPAANASEGLIDSFYSGTLPGGSWTRFFWMSREPAGTIALYVRDMGESLYGYRVQTVKEDDRQVRRVTVAKTEGKIDFVKLMTLAGKYFIKK